MPSVGSHSPQAKFSNTWKAWTNFWAKHNGSWKKPLSVHVKSGGNWVKVWDERPVFVSGFTIYANYIYTTAQGIRIYYVGISSGSFYTNGFQTTLSGSYSYSGGYSASLTPTQSVFSSDTGYSGSYFNPIGNQGPNGQTLTVTITLTNASATATFTNSVYLY